MQRFQDYEGRTIRLPDERLAHILEEHPEIRGLEWAIAITLAAPDHVIRSRSDAEVRLYYRWYTGLRVGEKYLCVVVKAGEGDAFVLSTYVTDKRKLVVCQSYCDGFHPAALKGGPAVHGGGLTHQFTADR
ncbi:MAG: hypothetical protein HY689_06810, partial [Chloroflexi bacterium]|nr:hypothetical protein [Chloroflexota bacterium]